MNKSRVVRRRGTVLLFFICLFVFRGKTSAKRRDPKQSKVLETQHQCYTINHMGVLGYLNSIYFVAKCFVIHWPWAKVPSLVLEQQPFLSC